MKKLTLLLVLCLAGSAFAEPLTQTNTEVRVCITTDRRSIYPIIPVGLYESSGYCCSSALKAPEKELAEAEKKAKAKEAKKAEWKAKREKFHKSHSPKLVSNPWPFN